jgi:hypothetical protein
MEACHDIINEANKMEGRYGRMRHLVDVFA